MRTHTVKNSSRYVALAVLMSMQGWAMAQQDGKTHSDVNLEVRIQICLPTKRIYFNDIELDRLENHPQFTKYSPEQLELAPKSIRRVARSIDPNALRTYGINYGEVLLRSGGYSDGSGFMPLRGSTVANQPVFELGYGYPANAYIAVHVRIPEPDQGPEGRVIYWFKLPSVVPTDSFSTWLSPVSMEPDGRLRPIWFRLTHGEDMEVFPVSALPPKMRVSLGKRNDAHNDPTNDTLPALTTARMKYKTTTSSQQFVYEFVAKANEPIPACDQ